MKVARCHIKQPLESRGEGLDRQCCRVHVGLRGIGLSDLHMQARSIAQTHLQCAHDVNKHVTIL